MGFLDKTGFTYFVNKVIGTTSISGVGDGTLKGAISTLNTGKLSKTGDASNVTTSFSQASSRANIATGEKQSVVMGKIKKWFADMTAAAFAQIISSNTDLMATTVAGYLVDALAVKQQFDVVNSNLNITEGLIATNYSDKSITYSYNDFMAMIYIDGLKNIAKGVATNICTLPEGARPSGVRVVDITNSIGAFVRVYIQANGDVLVYNYTDNAINNITQSFTYLK